jgi:hypothetical protein
MGSVNGARQSPSRPISLPPSVQRLGGTAKEPVRQRDELRLLSDPPEARRSVRSRRLVGEAAECKNALADSPRAMRAIPRDILL